MDRVAQLIRTAEALRRRIWASLPFTERFARVMYRLATSSSDAFGAGVYSLFLQHGIEGMPEVNGRPAAEFVGKRLPPSYGREFGKKVFLVLMRTHRNPSTVEDIMSAFLVKLMASADKYIKPGYNLKQAESYVLTGVTRDGISLIRRKKFEKSESQMRTTDDDDFGGSSFLDRTPAPPEDLREDDVYEEAFWRLLERPDVRAKLQRIHPSAEEYVRLKFEGRKDRAILGDPPMLSHPRMPNGGAVTPASWTPNKKKIFEVLKSEYEKLDIAV
jgi:DNA-directed RNA polymerase specialized sigma24 family protein